MDLFHLDGEHKIKYLKSYWTSHEFLITSSHIQCPKWWTALWKTFLFWSFEVNSTFVWIAEQFVHLSAIYHKLCIALANCNQWSWGFLNDPPWELWSIKNNKIIFDEISAEFRKAWSKQPVLKIKLELIELSWSKKQHSKYQVNYQIKYIQAWQSPYR